MEWWLSEMGQGELMGSICWTRIPFFIITTGQSHCLLLSLLYSANPPVDLKTHTSTGTVELFFVMILMTSYAYKLMFHVQSFSLLWSCLITPSFCDYDDSAYCQPHSGSAAYTLPIVIYFKLTGPCIALPPISRYIIRIGYMDWVSLALILLDSPLPYCLADQWT